MPEQISLYRSPRSSGHIGGRKLIVEDERLIGLALKDCLQRAGCHVTWVETDGAAYDALGAGGPSFDTLILDVDLGPGTTGFDIARFARARFPDIGVVYSSGNPAEWLDNFGVAGAIYLSKPFTEWSLIAALERLAPARPR